MEMKKILIDTNIYNDLKEKGAPIPTNDIRTAASAMENGAAVATRDEHFSKIEGLILIG
jgi:tRNA(fMet)-specific endonuclease VapC